jgi:predicted transposase YbfD/YdcC
MTAYMAQEWRWPGIQLSGRIRRSRKGRTKTDWESQETWTWVSSLSPELGTPERVAQDLRGHWAIENGVFRVRDVSYDEDRLHGRKIGHSLSIIRDIAITIIRRERYPYIPDGWRDIATHKDHGLRLLTKY